MTHEALIKMFGANMVMGLTSLYFVMKTNQLMQIMSERRQHLSLEERILDMSEDEKRLVLRRFTNRELRDEVERREG